MTDSPPTSAVAVLYSGGLDSAILLADLLHQRLRVTPLYIASGLHWQKVERLWAERFLAALQSPQLARMVVLDVPVGDIYANHWSATGQGTPGYNDPDEGVYLPGRNPLLLVKAHLWCHLHGVMRLASGSLASNPFPDATPAFFDQFAAVMNRAVNGQVDIERPFAQLSKHQVMQLGRAAPLALTFSCIAPEGEQHCGQCNKCAERQHAFADAAIPDPTMYVNSSKPPASSLQPPA